MYAWFVDLIPLWVRVVPRATLCIGWHWLLGLVHIYSSHWALVVSRIVLIYCLRDGRLCLKVTTGPVYARY